MTLDLYVRRDAWFHRLDPRTKLAFVLFWVMVLFIVNAPWPMLAALACVHALALTTRVPADRLGRAWRALWPITLLIIVLSSITWGAAGPALIRVGQFSVSTSSLWQAITMAARVDALAFGFLLLLWTTEQGELIAGLTRLGLSYGASLTLVIAMQFVPLLSRIFGEIVEAQQSRGLVIPRWNPIAAGRAYLPVLVPLLITALRMADNLSMALVARGYGAGIKRSSRRQLHLAGRDWLVILISLGVCATVLTSRLL